MGEPSSARPPDQRPGSVGDAEPWRVPRDHPAEPSLATVLVNTCRLWLERRGLRRPAGTAAGHASGWRKFGMLCLVLAVFAAGALTVALIRQAATAPGDPADPGGGSLRAAAAARGAAAAYVVGQVSRGAIVACDPVMCSALQARGFPAGSLLTLGSSAGDPLGSDIVVATAAVRSQFGSRLTSEYAPVAIAGFGSGTARVEVLVTATEGAAAYRSDLRADQRARRRGGAALLRGGGVRCSPQACAALEAGQVDARLLITLVAMASQGQVHILAFGGAAPGASPGVPLRTVELASPAGASGRSYLRSTLSFLRAQRAPFLASVMTTTRLASGRIALIVGFAAPSPLGLLGQSAPAQHAKNAKNAQQAKK